MLVLLIRFPLPRFLTVVILGGRSSAPIHSTPLGPLAPLDSARIRVQVQVRVRIQLQNRRCLCRPFFYPLQVDARLLPPPPRQTRSRSPSGPLIEVQNWSRCNILRDRFLPPRDGLPDPLEARFPHCLRQWRVRPTPIPPSPRLPPGEPSHDPVMEAIQCSLHPRCEHPCLCPK